MDVGTLSCHPSCHSWQVNTSWGSTAWEKQAQEAEISRLQPSHFLAVELPKAELVAGGQLQGACIQPTYSGTSEKQSNWSQTGRSLGMARASQGLSCSFSSNQEGENQPQLPAQPAVTLSSTVVRETEAGKGLQGLRPSPAGRAKPHSGAPGRTQASREAVRSIRRRKMSQGNGGLQGL